jgi:hypothetical protein
MRIYAFLTLIEWCSFGEMSPSESVFAALGLGADRI